MTNATESSGTVKQAAPQKKPSRSLLCVAVLNGVIALLLAGGLTVTLMAEPGRHWWSSSTFWLMLANAMLALTNARVYLDQRRQARDQ